MTYCRIFGWFEFRTPQYIVRDPELIKQIAVKDFDHFTDHRYFGNLGKIWENSMFFMRGEEWRQMRATLSPAFTGSKMRQMFELVADCADDAAKYFLKRIETEPEISIEVKDYFSRYTNDVIATCAFGLKTNSLEEPENEFYLNGKKLMDFFSLKTILRVLVIVYFPIVARALKISMTDKTVLDAFKSTILDTMNVRKKNNIYRPDMINLLMQIREGTLKQLIDEKNENEGFATAEESEVGKATVTRVWDDDEIVAQCFGFFIGGFETSSTVITFVFYELVVNPEIQQKLYEEIVSCNEQLGGKRINYDALQKMKYLDQVISETLRKWPPLTLLDRTCVKDYEYDDENKLHLKMDKGTVVRLTLYGIHHDPKYFPEPERFDPDRFSDANKDNIQPGTYIPFGVGPRNCIGEIN